MKQMSAGVHACGRGHGPLLQIFALLLVLLLWSPPSRAALQELADVDLGNISGQAILLADRIIGPGLPGGPAADSIPDNSFTYYRVVLDADLGLNLNIDKMQLGCGGFNEGLVPNACDIDIDFVSLMGSGGIGSDFVMQRPYIELAIKNDADKTKRELVGLKIGAALVDGIMSVGRIHANGATNLENGGVCDGTYANAEDNGSRLNCHSGINRLSGFVIAELSGYGKIESGLGNGNVCFGNIGNAPNGCSETRPTYLSVWGTRMNELMAIQVLVRVETGCTGALALLCPTDGYLDLVERFRFLHRLILTDTGTAPRVSRDFFLSFQREKVAYPIFDSSSPYETNGVGTGNKAYSASANTGWWMNVTYAAALGLNVGTLTISGGSALDALNEGANARGLTLGPAQVPLDNCYGNPGFC